MNKIYIISPTYTATGGTELLHQLSDALIDNDINVYMYYIGNYEGSKVKERFNHYKKNISTQIEDDEKNLVIVPETLIRELYKFKKAKKAIWWLSVDFYPGSQRIKINLMYTIVRYIRDLKLRLFDKNWIHFVQSEYANQYLLNERHIPKSKIYPLSDYISGKFFKGLSADVNNRKNTVLYNPKKGFEFTQKLIHACPEIEWVPLINLSPEQMKNTMLSSKVYIDFGNHPGKDRIPREAALCGCCVITGKRGSARNSLDVKIPEKYKFDDTVDNIQNIKEQIEYCLRFYQESQKDFRDYIIKIKNEETQFEQDVYDYFIRGRK